ncbi:MAG: hypothetical protein MJZ02_08255 [Paludibacteraceae bacterium]|nr:hypothetical protein [Paludibacteraceae bacterium]
MRNIFTIEIIDKQKAVNRSVFESWICKVMQPKIKNKDIRVYYDGEYFPYIAIAIGDFVYFRRKYTVKYLFKHQEQTINELLALCDKAELLHREITGNHSAGNCVDMGTGVLWHKTNVGANSVFEKGCLLAWGETEEKPALTIWNYNNIYSRKNYLHTNTERGTLTKYLRETKLHPTDNKFLLEPADDAATTVLGANWRTPTADEFQQLIDASNIIEVKKIGGSTFYIFESRINGNLLIFPSTIGYWTANLASHDTCASAVMYNWGICNANRWKPMHIRPVANN